MTPVGSTLRHTQRSVVANWPWCVPVAVAAFIYETNGAYLTRAVSALLAVMVVLAAARRPDRSLIALAIGLPFQTFALAQLYAWGMPAAIVRPLAGWKEALAIGVVIAGVRGFSASGRRLDRLDGLGIAYVAIVSAYAVFPHLFAPGAPVASDARSLAFRSTAGFVLLLLAARHCNLPHDFVTRFGRVVMIVGAIVAGIAVYEYCFSSSWNHFVIHRIQYLRYQVDILHTTPFSFTDVRRYGYIGGRRFVRSGSLFLDPTPCGFFLILPLAVGIEHGVRNGLRRGTWLLLATIAGGLLVTQTRAALLGALAVAFLATHPAAGRRTSRRLQFTLIFAAAAVIATPVVTATGLSERVTTTRSGSDQSSIDHVQSFWHGVDAIRAEPIGHGLGTSAGVGQRFDAPNTTITENAYLQVGIETGVFSMAVFAALTIAMLRRLHRSAVTVSDLGIAATWSAGVGLAIGAFLLHTWSEFAVAWTFWGAAGAAIGVAETARRAREDGPSPALVLEDA